MDGYAPELIELLRLAGGCHLRNGKAITPSGSARSTSDLSWWITGSNLGTPLMRYSSRPDYRKRFEVNHGREKGRPFLDRACVAAMIIAITVVLPVPVAILVQSRSHPPPSPGIAMPCLNSAATPG